MKNLLLDNVAAINEVRRTAEALKTGGVSLNGVSGPVKTVIIAALDRIFSEQGSLAFLVSGRDEIPVSYTHLEAGCGINQEENKNKYG